MTEILATLRTGRYSGSMHQPGVGTTHLEFDVVNGLQLAGTTPLDFTHFSLPSSGEHIHRLSLPEQIARKIHAFSETTYVNGRGGFNCRAFLGYVMGWDADIKIGADAHRAYHGNYVSPTNTRSSLPYLIGQEDGGITQHAVLGIEEPGMSLSVAGHECPLIIANNSDLLRAFGGTAMLEVTSIADA